MSEGADAVKKWRFKTKDRIILSMGGSCVCCGYNKCQSALALALHHLDPSQKEFNLGALRANIKSWDKIVIELRKCVLICHNCHSEYHEGLIDIPEDALRFDEKMSDYKLLEKQDRENDPLRYHSCPKCNKQTHNSQKHCSQKCSAAAALCFNWKEYDLEKMHNEMPVIKIAEMIGCSDVAVHKKLKRLGLK